MKKANGVFVGILFIIVGLLYACSALNLFEFTIFFPGWWTLFIIVPCIYALSHKKEDKTGAIIGLIIGLCFFVNAQDIDIHIDFFPMALAVLCIIIGWKLIVPQKRRGHTQREYHFTYDSSDVGTTSYAGAADSNTGSSFHNTFAGNNTSYTSGNGYINASAILGGKDIRVDNECFTGADICVVMGAVDLNLKNAIISEDVYINVTAIMGGVDIYIPANVRVVTDGCATVMGAVEVNDSYINFHSADSPRVIITGNCVMGGVEIR